MVKLIVLAGVAGLGLVPTAHARALPTAHARALPKIEGDWPVASIERMMADKAFYEDEPKRRCNAHGHCTRTFYEDEVGTRVDIAVKAGRVYRMVCVKDDRSEGCGKINIWRYLKPPPSC